MLVFKFLAFCCYKKNKKEEEGGKRGSGRKGEGTGNVGQQSAKAKLKENSVLFVPVLAASFSSHAQNVDWGGERVPRVLAVEHPRL